MERIFTAANSDIATSVSEQVYRIVREAIVTLALLPNMPISENSLVKQVGASRTPVRQALQRLEREGLVIILPQRGSFVSPLDLQTIRSAYMIRRSLECTVAGEAARLHTASDVVRLRGEIEAQRNLLASATTAGFFDLNRRFHRDLMNIADLAGLDPVIDNAAVQLGRVRAAHLMFADPYPLEPLVEQHEAILAAVAAGDPGAAEAAMRAHIEPLLPRLTLLLQERPDFFQRPRDPGKPDWGLVAGGRND